MLESSLMKEFTLITNAFIDELKTYASRLTLRTPTKYDAPSECKQISEETTKTTTPVEEKLIYERQMLAVIALLCTDFSNATQLLLFDKCDESPANEGDDDEMDGVNRIGSFADILTDVLYNIGSSVSVLLCL